MRNRLWPYFQVILSDHVAINLGMVFKVLQDLSAISSQAQVISSVFDIGVTNWGSNLSQIFSGSLSYGHWLVVSLVKRNWPLSGRHNSVLNVSSHGSGIIQSEASSYNNSSEHLIF